jgi:hypothetical protein
VGDVNAEIRPADETIMLFSEEYRRFAVECRAQAEKLPRPEDKERLIQIAKTWSNIADEHAEKESKRSQIQSRSLAY